MSAKPWEDEYVLRKLYCEQDLTMEEVGNVLGCSRHPIHQNLKRYNIRRQDPVHHRINDNGYEVWMPNVDGQQYTIPVHRLLAVSEWGLETLSDNHVHHKNGVRWDNRRENLEVLDESEHRKRHAKYNWIEKLGWAEMYKNTEMTQRELGQVVEVPHSTLATALSDILNRGERV